MNPREEYVPKYQQQKQQQQYVPKYQQQQQEQQQEQQQQQYVPKYQQQQQQYVPKYQQQQQQQNTYIPSTSSTVKQQEPPREYRQFQQAPPIQKQYTSYGDEDQYGNGLHTTLNVFEQGVMKRTLETEKVDRVEAKVMQNQYNNAQQTRDLTDKQLHNRPIDERPETIKVEKKDMVDLNLVAAKRDQETSQLKIEKKESDASILMGSMAVKKTDADKLNRDMNELIKRRELEIKNIEYK
jgi:hypothetical protein